MLRRQPLEEASVFIAQYIDQQRDDPDGDFDTQYADGLHDTKDRPDGRRLTIGTQAIFSTSRQRLANPAYG